ncbi:hypothetical protein JI666_09090 [Bacillus sp. NTK071]|uniref:hypothetical protein n=1 Tax=Bacillus sp. NTK071 TaxID=2802175 RepID=UPI001A90A286|nr:hypothetical protein [Bacillus sp. NTK071]MBN8208898.1 hypothetical protein [Bacillus sp. NTK071]
MVSSDDRKSINFNTTIRPHEDHLYKTNVLQSIVEQIEDQDQKFKSLIRNVIVGEQQDGEWAESVEETTDKLTKRAMHMTSDLKDQIKHGVITFDQQVEKMKEQNVTITYTQSGSAF